MSSRQETRQCKTRHEIRQNTRQDKRQEARQSKARQNKTRQDTWNSTLSDKTRQDKTKDKTREKREERRIEERYGSPLTSSPTHHPNLLLGCFVPRLSERLAFSRHQVPRLPFLAFCRVLRVRWERVTVGGKGLGYSCRALDAG
jgi:hypothetical protein